MQSTKDRNLFTALRQCWTIPSCQMTSGYMAVLFISIGQMPFLAPPIDDADPPFALVIATGFYLHHVELAKQDSANGSL